MKSKISYILSIVITTSLWAGQEELNMVKEKWMQWANGNVASERDAFLKNYGLDSSALDNSSVLELFKANSDQRVKLEIDAVRQQTTRFSKMVGKIKSLFFTTSEDEKFSEKNAESIKKIAAKKFNKCNNVEILDNPKFKIGDVGVFKHYKNNTCYVALNCAMHLKNVPQLEEVLMHECSHILHEDNINEEIMQYTAWEHSTVEREEIEGQTLSYHKAFETRADVYAAVNSPDHGKYLINLFKTFPEDSEAPTHPKDSGRTALLEKVKSELDLASEKQN